MMSSRPDIRIEKDKSDRILSKLATVILLLNIAATVWIYFISPANIPGHFNTEGKVTRYDSRETVFIFPVIMLFVYGLLSLLMKYPALHNYPKKITAENAEMMYRSSIRLLRLVLLGILVLFSCILLLMYQGIRDQFLPLHRWEMLIPLLLSLGLPLLIWYKLFQKK